jgi:hypothetical protein
MNVLELFAGSRSIGKAAEQLNMQVFSTDIDPFEGIDYVVDILEFDFAKVPFVPDVIWASPPCTSFSVASMWRHWKMEGEKSIPLTDTARLGVKLVKKTLEIIEHYQRINPDLKWYMENPRGKLRKMPFVQHLPIRHTVTYCQYGDFRMKPTDIWTNNMKWKPRAMCKPRGACHISSPRGSHTGTQGMSNSFERSKIPDELCLEVLQVSRLSPSCFKMSKDS